MTTQVGARLALAGAAALNLVPLAYTGLWLAPGTVAGGAADARLRFIAAHATLWAAGWGLWMGGSVGLLLSVWVLARVFRQRTPAGETLRLAVPFAIVGATLDILGDAIQAGAFPALAQRYVAGGGDATAALLFQVADRLANLLSGGIANTAYFVAGALVTVALARAPRFPAGVTALGALAWLATLAATPALAAPAILPVVIASTLGLYTAWLVAIAIWGIEGDLPRWVNRVLHRV